MTEQLLKPQGPEKNPLHQAEMPAVSLCQSLYQINTRVWLKRLGPDAKLDDIPESVWRGLAERGMDMVWMMGVWSGCADTVPRCCFIDDLRKAYNQALPGWNERDVIGSPYAIDTYTINPALGGGSSLDTLRRSVNRHGLRLVLDLVPNHFSEGSSLITSAPYVFLQAPPGFENRQPVYFRPAAAPGLVLAHGRFPNEWEGWGDTAQVNYFNEQAVQFMIDRLLEIAEHCDGVRCDVAHLVLNNVFADTWKDVIQAAGLKRPAEEFWGRAIAAVKARHPGFIFIAEVYDDTLAWDLQQLGFDYTYDKTLYDRLLSDPAGKARDHLRWATPEFQRKLVRFIENHDEKRAVTTMGVEKSMAAAVVTSTLTGMRFYHDGQFEGRRARLPVQLGREPQEPVIDRLAEFYERLLAIVKEPVFREGEWRLAETTEAGDQSFNNFLAYTWTRGGERRLVVVNHADSPGRCHIKLKLDGYPETVGFHDLLHGQSYSYRKKDLDTYGLFIRLHNFGTHIFAF